MTEESKTLDLFAEDTHASLSASQENGVAQKMTAISGRKCLGLSDNSGRIGLLEKMLLDTSRWGSTKCLLTWKAKATPQGRLLFQLVPSMLPTEETECGLLHTPTAKANQLAPSMNSGWWRTPAAETGGTPKALLEGKTRRASGHKIQIRLQDQVKMWPTPRASEHKGVGPIGSKSHSHMLDKGYLCAVAQQQDGVSGSLNPAWVEWLMGFPIGHTDLNS